MKIIDENRRNALKSMAAFSALALVTNTLYGEEIKKNEILVLLNDSIFTTDFIKGIKKVESNSNNIEKVDLIGDYASFNNIFKKHLLNKNIKKITGLLTHGDYILFVEKIKGSGIELKAEIFHSISQNGTEHNFCVTNSASNIMSNAKTILEIDNNWAQLTGFILGGANTSSVLSRLNKNGFKETTIKKNQIGDTKLVSFLATINKEIKNV